MTRDEAIALRVAQGLPPQVENPETIKFLAALLATADPPAGDKPVHKGGKRRIRKSPPSS